MTQKSLIQVENLTKTYGREPNAFKALKGVSFSINTGESLAIVGKSGSGKSTLMHLLALMDKPTSGSIILNGKDASSFSKKELDIYRNETLGFVFQQFFLNGRATVLENVILPLKIAGVSPSERKQRGLEVLRIVELEDKADNKANDLSGGQKQRVVIARALINNPAVIYADEFTGNLDSETGEKIENLVFSLQKEKGVTLIIVTHDPELAAKCDRQLIIKDGLIGDELRND